MQVFFTEFEIPQRVQRLYEFENRISNILASWILQIYENASRNIHKQRVTIFGYFQPTCLRFDALFFKKFKKSKIDLYLWMFPELNWRIRI